MIAATTKFFSFLSPTRITGPIFEKELRVSSRRKRTYLLRFFFIIAITTFIAIVWMNVVERSIFSRFGGFSISGNLSVLKIQAQMAMIGKMIITSIAWFLFYTMPTLAVILLSSAISSEIQGKTIGVLVSTPITSFQIVMGKMLSKLYQLILLMAISVPILSMIRVFGGVPWNFIISTFCVTLSLTIFAASLSLFLSIYIKKPFVVIPVIVILFAVVMGLFRIELMHRMFSRYIRNEVKFLNFAYALNPYELLRGLEYSMKYPGRAFMIKDFIWQLHCGISLLFSMVILLIASLKVRKVALMQVTGQLSPLKRWLNTDSEEEFCGVAKPVKEKPIRNVSDNPVIWREARSSVFVKRRFLRIAAVAIVGVGSGVAFLIGIIIALMEQSGYLRAYSVGFMIFGTIFTVIFPASCIPAEKESRSWVMLMSTPLTEWQILKGKFVGVLRKCMLPWTLLLLFIFYTTVLGVTHPLTALFIALNITSVVVLLSGSGLFFGTLFRKSNAAVIANILFAAAVWFMIPFLLSFFWRFTNDLGEFCLSMHPFIQASVVMDMVNLREGYAALEYRWPSERLGAGMTLVTITISTLIHVSIGVFFIICAKKRLRKNIF